MSGDQLLTRDKSVVMIKEKLILLPHVFHSIAFKTHWYTHAGPDIYKIFKVFHHINPTWVLWRFNKKNLSTQQISVSDIQSECLFRFCSPWLHFMITQQDPCPPPIFTACVAHLHSSAPFVQAYDILPQILPTNTSDQHRINIPKMTDYYKWFHSDLFWAHFSWWDGRALTHR